MANDMGISRRNALAGLAGSAALLAGEKTAVAAASNGTEPIVPAAANVCRMTPEAVEGPFYFDPDLDRADITEGRLGIPLPLVLQVIEGATCVPIEGARVDVWHCDAIGHYSGYDRQGDDGAISTVSGGASSVPRGPLVPTFTGAPVTTSRGETSTVSADGSTGTFVRGVLSLPFESSVSSVGISEMSIAATPGIKLRSTGTVLRCCCEPR